MDSVSSENTNNHGLDNEANKILRLAEDLSIVQNCSHNSLGHGSYSNATRFKDLQSTNKAVTSLQFDAILIFDSFQYINSSSLRAAQGQFQITKQCVDYIEHNSMA